MLTSLFQTISCALFFCTLEHPSDPLASQRSHSARSLLLSDRSMFDNEIRINSKADLNPIVHTNLGAVEGYVMKTIKGRSIYAYEGIPFAESTGGPNRFKLPIPKSPWSGILPAKQVSEFCLQQHLFHAGRTMGSEDCLFLNVYTPTFPLSRKRKADLPTIVWLHGGAWYFGSGAEYGPSYLLENDVILVTINYRVGVFGFLSTGDSVLPGNLGLKDQREALKWVHENIEHFGGDPSLVTIAGQSSGAASVHLHMISNSSREYFSGAISMSGTAYSSWALMNKRTLDVRNRKLSTATRCPLSSNQEYIQCLREMDGPNLSQRAGSVYDYMVLPTVPLGAVIEGDGPGAFLTEHPDRTYARNRVANVPWIVIRTHNEMEMFFKIIGRLRERALPRIGNRRSMRRLFRFVAPYLLDYVYVAKNPQEVTDKIFKFYFGTSNDSNLPGPPNLAVASELTTDRLFTYGFHKSLRLHSHVAPTYAGVYAYQGRNSVSGVLGLNPKDAVTSHMDDLASYFNMSSVFSGYKTTDPEYAIVKLMTSTLYNFAAKREPLYRDEERRDHRIWDPVRDPKNIKALQINNDVKMVPEPFTERLKFWETLLLEELKPSVPTE